MSLAVQHIRNIQQLSAWSLVISGGHVREPIKTEEEHQGDGPEHDQSSAVDDDAPTLQAHELSQPVE